MLDVHDLTVNYEAKPVFQHLSISIARGEIVALTGPSGSGKTTLLRCIAGLEHTESGSVWLNGEDITQRPAHLRHVGLVFQDNQLFPHLNVTDNVAYSLKLQRVAAGEREQRVDEALELVGLAHLAKREVVRLSGGEAKRIAVARALVAQPDVLLLDEPLTGLDDELHDRLLEDLAALLRSRSTTTLHVTHDRTEAETMADRVVDIRDLIHISR